MRPELLNPFFKNISTLKGIGPKLTKIFEKLLGGVNIIDLLAHTPVNTIKRCYIKDITKAKPGDYVIISAKILKHYSPPKKRRIPHKITCEDEKQNIFEILYFNIDSSYIKKQLPENNIRLISGKIEFYGRKAQIAHPDYILHPGEISKIKTIEPVYPLTAGISNKYIIKIMDSALKEVEKPLNNLPEWLDPKFSKQKGFLSFADSIISLHNPKSLSNISDFGIIKQRLAYDEILAAQLTLALLRAREKNFKGQIHFKENNIYRQKLSESLPFELTNAQKNVIKEIDTDMKSDKRMIRLLQGDVGSGKTLVALYAVLNVVNTKKQAVIMVPTDILANQHYKTITNILKNAGIKDINTLILTGKDKGKARDEKLKDIKEGNANIIIGTHALFQDTVLYNNLGLSVIDEQHRFGVEQRLKLTEKSKTCDILVMTATPIPRTLTLTLYGDMDISQIDEMPKNRKPVETVIIPISKQNELIKRIQTLIDKNDKIYWVCPLVKESEKLDLAAAEERYNILKKYFKDKVSLVHGKIKKEEKDKIMSDFANPTGNAKILVATTVIEVGVNVPDATIMIIEHAERFGLSQLHQLRGRIGRGSKQGKCILMHGNKLNETSVKRLKTMRDTHNGFIIAEEDLKIRGAGEILGTKQSGIPDFKFADFEIHKNLFYTAKKDADLIIAKDPKFNTKRGKALKHLLYLFKQDIVIKNLKSG